MSAEAAHQASDRFEGYHSITRIYEGAETLVYRAKAVGSDAPVILKRTKNDYPSAREIARLRREFVILRELDLARTPKAIRLEERGRGAVLAMEDLGLPTLRELLEQRKLDVESALTIAISLSTVLGDTHRKRVIHKDVTPRNILVDPVTLEAYLIDFGISARIQRELKAPSGPRALEGTLLYMAPEQTGRMNRAVDARADLYALGVVLYEMLTGSVPFPERDPEEIVHNHMTMAPVPPRLRSAAIPAPLSDIVLLLLAKTPEERYQSDAGLRADLTEALRQWRGTKSIEPFPLRQHDRATELRGAQRLYGRDADLEALLAAFGRAKARGPELVLVSGYSGVGKSALVHEVHKFIARNRGGFFISGKFDKISRDIPLAPITTALRDLMQQILTEPPEVLAAWKSKLEGALGGNGRVLCDLVPELELVIGPQPEVAEVAPDQAKNRFEMTLQDFLHVFASEKHPLVLFLDDLQWMDPASRRLLQFLLTDPYSKHQLIIGAYRDNEVEPGHPLLSMLGDLEKMLFRATHIRLAPLDEKTTTQLVADTLTSKPEEVASLASVVYEKTHGNPFFAHRFLVTLNDQDLVRFDATSGAWQWDLDAIAAARVTDNVVDLMLQNLRRLSSTAQDVLMRAACFGHSFDFDSLALIAEMPGRDVSLALFDAMRSGLCVSLDSDYKFLESGPDSGYAAPLHAFDVRYAFVHDRVLEAAYELAPPAERQKLHLTIGRLLQRRAGGEIRDEDILDIVHHLNRGAAGIDDPREKLELAALNLRAGRKARSATAYHAAAEYMRAGIQRLAEQDWTTSYDLCFALHLEGAQCEYLSASRERAEVLFDKLTAHARDDLDRVTILRQRILGLTVHSLYKEVLVVGCQALSLLGHPLSVEEILSPAVMMAELALINENLRGRRIVDLEDAPEAEDPTVRATLSVLDAMGVSAFHNGPVAFSVVNFRTANTAIVHGPTVLCGYPFAAVGYCLAGLFGRVDEGMAFAKLAEAINRRFPSASQAARLYLPVASSMHMRHPMRDPKPYYALIRQKGLESGEFDMIGSACLLDSFGDLCAGALIDEALAEAEKYLALCRRIRDPFALANMTILRQTFACFAGKTRDRLSLDDDAFREDDYVAGFDPAHFGTFLAHYHFAKTFVALIHGRFDAALASADKAESFIQYSGGNLPSKVHLFLHSLALLLAPRADDAEESKRREELLEKHRPEMEMLAASSPQSFAHLKALVDAVGSRREGTLERTIRAFEAAIQLCQDNKAPHFEAFTNELCATFYLSLGAPTAGSGYMRNAYRAYVHWGALVKAEALVDESQHIFPTLREVSRTRSDATTQTGTSQLSHVGRTLIAQTNLGSLRDAALVVRAAQEIASEIDLPKVVDRLTRLVLDNAGADRGALILVRDGQFFVEATFGESEGAISVGRGRRLDRALDYAQSVILYVARTQEHVLLDDTRKTTKFAEDPWLKAGAPKSILCVPLLHQGRLSGVLYLENTAASGVFSETRVQLLTLLSSQAAIAIEIARLIASAHAASEEVKRANERLELEVAHRTEELRQVNQSLSETNSRLEDELVTRMRIEEERAALQEKVIRAQKERLAELSTPLLPISTGIMVMPLIGAMDNERAGQVLAVALEGAQRQNARQVILDVTGLKEIDTHVASMLLNVASALRLLGAETILTGIAPRIAQTLVSLDVDLKSFVTKGTLQSGMDYALARARGGGATAVKRPVVR